MPRDAGRVDPAAVRSFLAELAATMPRAVVRAAVEKLAAGERVAYRAA